MLAVQAIIIIIVNSLLFKFNRLLCPTCHQGSSIRSGVIRLLRQMGRELTQS